jgi:hypothetical protein
LATLCRIASTIRRAFSPDNDLALVPAAASASTTISSTAAVIF